MLNYLILCRSLTYAQRTAKVLERSGIRGSVQRLPKSISKDGCGYCVKIAERHLGDALKILHKAQLAPRQVYLQSAQGELSEVAL